MEENQRQTNTRHLRPADIRPQKLQAVHTTVVFNSYLKVAGEIGDEVEL